VSKHKRTVWDDLVEIGREILEQIDQALNPDYKRREPVRIPVPVRKDNNRLRDPYSDSQ
jgi:hypothetical protein